MVANADLPADSGPASGDPIAGDDTVFEEGGGHESEGANGCTPDMDEGLVTLSVADEVEGKLAVSVKVGTDLPAKALSVALRADDGHAHLVWSKPIDVSAPEVGGEQAVMLDLDDVGLDLSGQRFSGMVRATVVFLPGPDGEAGKSGGAGAEGEPGQDSEATGGLQSEPLFFHREGNAWRIYDEATLHSTYSRGDLKGALAPIADAVADLDATSPAARVSGARIVDPSAEPSGDEGPMKAVDEGANAVPIDAQSPRGKSRDPATSLAVEKTTLGTRTMCIRSFVTARDSSIMFRSDAAVPFATEEDWTNTTGDGSGSGRGPALWKSRNARVYWSQLSSGAFNDIFLDENGCTSNLPITGGNDFFVRVYTQAKDGNGNVWDVYTGTCVPAVGPCPANAPGPLAFADFTVSIPANDTTTIVDYQGTVDEEKWLIFATTAFSQWRVGSHLSNSRIHVCEQELQGQSFNTVNDLTNKRGCIDIGTGSGDPPNGVQADVRSKYLVAHEIGHALGYLYAQDTFNGAAVADDDGDSMHEVTEFNPRRDEKNPAIPLWIDDGFSEFTCDVNGAPYNLYSYEWNSLALREAFANLVATRVFNDRAEDAVFIWSRSSLSDSGAGRPWTFNSRTRELLDETSDLIGAGGRLESTVVILPLTIPWTLEPPCCPSGKSWTTTCRTGAATIRDWTGALWNWYASDYDGACSPGHPGAGVIGFDDVLVVMDMVLDRFRAPGTGSPPAPPAVDQQDDAALHFASATADAEALGGIPGCTNEAWLQAADDFGVNN